MLPSKDLTNTFGATASTMNATCSFLMAFHVVGVLFNLRTLASCFKDKARYTVLENCRGVMIFQCMLHIALLALNAEESLKTFVFSMKEQNWCATNNVLVILLGFLLVYNLLGMLAIEYHSVVCLKRALVPQVALLGTLTAGIITTGLFLWGGFFTLEELCASHLATTVTCSLLLVLMLSIVWQICSSPEYIATKMKSSAESSGNLLNLLSKNKTSACLTFLFLFCVALTFLVDLIDSNVSFEDFEKVVFYERVFYLFVMCFGVGISLPVIFHEIIVSSVDEELITDDPTITVHVQGEKTLSI